MLHVGYGNYVPKNKILAITEMDAAPLRRQKQNAEDMRRLIDCTKGRRTLSLVHLVDGFIVSSANSPEKLFERMEGDKNARHEITSLR